MTKERGDDALVSRFWSKVQKADGDGCWEWTANRHRQGYGLFWNKGTTYAHRLAWELTHGAVPAGLHVLHACDNPACVRPAHLRVGTHRENMRDMAERKRAARTAGADNGNSKITAEDARLIWSSTEAGAVLARQLGVSPGTVSHVRTRRTWKHITGEHDDNHRI